MSHEEDVTLNIGALSTATGVPVETIRTWERRYGYPESQRNDAGHRIYELETIEHLRLVTTILSRGYRPSQLEGRSREELEELVERTGGIEEEPDGLEEPEPMQWRADWFDAVTRFDRPELVGGMRNAYSRLNALDFLERMVSAFLTEVGMCWAESKIGVAHEHFASECVRDFLSERWRLLNKTAFGPPMVLATLPGEEHSLSLHMVALVATMADRRVVFLGANTPVEDIAVAADHCEAESVAVSISECAATPDAVSFLIRLRELVGPEASVYAGGAGAPDEVRGVEVIKDLREFYRQLS